MESITFLHSWVLTHQSRAFFTKCKPKLQWSPYHHSGTNSCRLRYQLSQTGKEQKRDDEHRKWTGWQTIMNSRNDDQKLGDEEQNYRGCQFVSAGRGSGSIGGWSVNHRTDRIRLDPLVIAIVPSGVMHSVLNTARASRTPHVNYLHQSTGQT